MCCQSPVLAIIMEIPKMAKIVYRQMPAPRELSKQIPPSGKSPRVMAKFWCKSPGVHGGGGMVMDEIDTCIKQGHLFPVWKATVDSEK